ncbi:MAG: aspartate aminotransferase family protein, partial [Bacteroidetes bacterium]|nr:aspartate aminotransferase family protein [Bacteroidota bacterium]
MMKTELKVLPEKGLSTDEISKKLRELKQQDLNDEKLRLLTGMHQGDENVKQVCQDAYNLFFHNNAFIAAYEDGQKQILSELRQMTVEILNGGDEGCVNITTGGSESIFCAMHAAREWAKATKPDVQQPYHIVLSRSAHAAFDKAAHSLGMEVSRVAWKEDYRADVETMEAAIQANTIAIVGSAPMWGFGLVDPIAEIGELAQKYNLWMHSDCCVGGYLLRWMEELGCEIPTWDFRVPGVYSISADLHKHGYAAKPCSTVLYRNQELQNYHWTGVDITDWQSGSYKTEGVAGSRPFASTASAWAVMKHLGHEGWLDITR